MSINLEQAKEKATEYLNSITPSDGVYELIDSKVKEESDGWYFPYQSVEFLLTGDFNKSLVGNWPIFVSKDGKGVGPRRPGAPFIKP